MRKTITLLTILLLVVFMIGCENSINPIQPQTQNDNEGISLAKSGKTDGCITIQSGLIFASTGEVLTTGFDEYGYNYQGHMFKGRYCDYDRVEGGPYCDVNLIMKWNDAWMSNTDCDVDGLLDRHYGFTSYIGSGAWLTNHQSGEYDGCKWNYFVKIVAVPADAYKPWDLTGDWVIAVNDGNYLHDYTFTMTSLLDGTFTGVGGYPASSTNYTYDEIVTNGQINGDEISFTATYYQNGVPTGYAWDAIGTIDNSGELSGTGTSGVYEWHSTSGKAIADTWYNADDVEIGPVIWNQFAIIQQVENDQCAGIHGLQYNSPDHSGLGGW